MEQQPNIPLHKLDAGDETKISLGSSSTITALISFIGGPCYRYDSAGCRALNIGFVQYA